MSNEAVPPSDLVIADRRGSDRRNHGDRRKRQLNVALERRAGAERRNAPERRADAPPPVDPKDEEEIRFMEAMDEYKWANRRPFPTWSEVLEVLRSLGFRKTGAVTPVAAPDPAPTETAPAVPAVVEQRGSDRRAQGDRRKRQVPVAVERRSGADRRSGLDRRIERRRQVDPTTCEKEYSDEEIVFMKAMDNYKRINRRPFPTWSEVLEVLRSLGYRKTAEATALPGNILQSVSVREEDEDDEDEE